MPREPGGAPDRSKYDIAALQKAFDVLEILAFATPRLTLHELSERSGFPKPTTYRILANLLARGYADRDGDGCYRLGSRARLLAGAHDERVHLRDAAIAHMHALRDAHGHTVSLAIRLASRILYVDIVEGTNALRFVEPPGSTGPLHATALGKALLAWTDDASRTRLLETIEYQTFTPETIASADALADELQRVRQRGFAIDAEESVLGARCIGVPILDSTGHATAALSISAPSASLEWSETPDLAADIIVRCRTIATQLEEDNHVR